MDNRPKHGCTVLEHAVTYNMRLLLFFKSWEFVCLHRSLSTLSQSHKFRSRCPALIRSRSWSLGIFKAWSRSPNFFEPWSWSPTKNEDSASLEKVLFIEAGSLHTHTHTHTHLKSYEVYHAVPNVYNIAQLQQWHCFQSALRYSRKKSNFTW